MKDLRQKVSFKIKTSTESPRWKYHVYIINRTSEYLPRCRAWRGLGWGLRGGGRAGRPWTPERRAGCGRWTSPPACCLSLPVETIGELN